MADEQKPVLKKLNKLLVTIKMVKAKLEMETLGKILLLTAFLIIFLILFKGCQDQMENVGVVGTNEYLCWLSQAMKADLSFLFPSACYVIDVEEPQDMEGISLLMRKCWWINGQGEKDINSEENWAKKIKDEVVTWSDMARTCYVFTPKEDTPITDFEEYLKTHDRTGKEVKEDSESTTWNYIQKKPTEKTGICFDKKFEDDLKLQKGKMYYIIFYDDKSPLSEGERDRILISRDPEFGKEQTGFKAVLKNILGGIKEIIKLKEDMKAWDDRHCYSPEGARSGEREEEKEKQKAEEEKQKAVDFFNDLIKSLGDCAEMSVNKQCLCTHDFHSGYLGKGYKIEFGKAGAISRLTLKDEGGEIVASGESPYVFMKEGSDSGLISSKDEGYVGTVYYYYELTLHSDKTFVLKRRTSEDVFYLSDCKRVAEEFAKEREKATGFFNDLVNLLNNCAKLSVAEQCLCTQDFHPGYLGKSYKIEFEKTGPTSRLTLKDEKGEIVASGESPYVFMKEGSDSGLISSRDVYSTTEGMFYYYELTLQPDKTFILERRITAEAAPTEYELPDCGTAAEEFAKEKEKAIEFFNDLIKSLGDCAEMSVNKQCLCTQDFRPGYLGRRYKIEFEKAGLISRLTLKDEGGETVASGESPYVFMKEGSDSGLISSRDVYSTTEGMFYYYELTLQPDIRKEKHKAFVLEKITEKDAVRTDPIFQDCGTVAEGFAKEKEEERQKKLCESYKKEEDCFAHSDKCYPPRIEPFSCEYCGGDFNCISIPKKEWCGMKPWCSTNCKWSTELGGCVIDRTK